jgi:hypothetical protein
MGLTVLWTLRSAAGHLIECQLKTEDDDEDGEQSVNVVLARGGETILSEWFNDREAALERCLRLYRQVEHHGWQE